MNINLISIAMESPRKMKKLSESINTPFPLIVDRAGTITKAYDVYFDKNHPDFSRIKTEHAIPAKFLINQEKKIVWKLINPDQKRPSIKDLKDAIQINL
ncbi:MAG: redoxin domain-containing protein [Candidatus Lokiarchaeota archaeon]|nr:redoxin domain-containing protein [Candidatus Lokiarchaeota archaeon]